VPALVPAAKAFSVRRAAGTTVHSGVYELAGGAKRSDEANRVFFSGAGMVQQLDSLLSQFAGVPSGFDIGDEIAPTAWDLVRASSAMSWMRETSEAPSIDNGGDISNLTSLRQICG